MLEAKGRSWGTLDLTFLIERGAYLGRYLPRSVIIRPHPTHLGTLYKVAARFALTKLEMHAPALRFPKFAFLAPGLSVILQGCVNGLCSLT